MTTALCETTTPTLKTTSQFIAVRTNDPQILRRIDQVERPVIEYESVGTNGMQLTSRTKSIQQKPSGLAAEPYVRYFPAGYAPQIFSAIGKDRDPFKKTSGENKFAYFNAKLFAQTHSRGIIDLHGDIAPTGVIAEIARSGEYKLMLVIVSSRQQGRSLQKKLREDEDLASSTIGKSGYEPICPDGRTTLVVATKQQFIGFRSRCDELVTTECVVFADGLKARDLANQPWLDIIPLVQRSEEARLLESADIEATAGIDAFLEKIQPHKQVAIYGLVRNCHALPVTERDWLVGMFGPHSCTVKVLDRFAFPIEVDAVLRPPQTNRPPRPSKTLTRVERARFISDELICNQARMKWCVRMIGKIVGVSRASEKQFSPVRPNTSRVAVLAANGQQLIELLKRLPELFVGASCMAPDLIKRFPELKKRLISLQVNKKAYEKRSVGDERWVVATLEDAQKLGSRDIWIRVDGSGRPLRLTGRQSTVPESHQRIRLYDFVDIAPPELEKNATNRFAQYVNAGFKITNLPSFMDETTLAKQRPLAPQSTQIPYQSAKPNAYQKDNSPLARCARKSKAYKEEYGQLVIDEVADPEILMAASGDLQNPSRHGQAPGIDGVAPADFSYEDRWNLGNGLSKVLLTDEWYPAAEKKLNIPKPTGGTRTISVPTVPDRVVHWSLARAIRNHWQPSHPDAAWATPGIGAPKMFIAVQDTIKGQLRDPSAQPVVACLDIKQAFDRVLVPEVLKAMHAAGLFPEPIRERHHLIFNIEKAMAQTGRARDCAEEVIKRALLGHRRTEVGIAQGSALSPIALEILLDQCVIRPLNEADLDPRVELFCYVDDITIVGPSVKSVRKAVELVREALEKIGLTLNKEKKRVADLTAGETAHILGMEVSVEDDKVRFGIPQQPLVKLSSKMELHNANGTTNVGKEYLRQWVNYYSLALTSRQAQEELAACLQPVGITRETTQELIKGRQKLLKADQQIPEPVPGKQALTDRLDHPFIPTS